jgi:hypothetical protein
MMRVYKIRVSPFNCSNQFTPMKNRIVLLLTCLSLAVSATANAGLLSQRSAANDSIADFNKRMPPKEAAIASSVREAEFIGWDIYRHEALQDIAGYAIVGATSSAQRAIIIGSIVVPGSAEWIVRFYGKNDRGNFIPVADVSFDGNDRYSVRKDGLQAFGAQEIALIKATELVKAQEDPCDGTYKTVALLKADKSIHVYSIRDCMDATHFPEGQHIRFIISQDGARIVSQHDFARRCNMVYTSISGETKLEEVKLTNSIDMQPTEMHVYLSLRYGVSIFLATTQSNLYWQINKGIVTAD